MVDKDKLEIVLNYYLAHPLLRRETAMKRRTRELLEELKKEGRG